ncbi:hypothetical protein [Roseovarius pacificus]|uniref:hypothetical protein n=1 Tax=Roseovarius pacificus TaxID=337701 RepID=UPI002A18E502|nr:hypothetical protein [Roseovarius pacificus]
MNEIVPTRRMPKHLQGTRQGLFFLLQSAPNLVAEDVTTMQVTAQTVRQVPQPPKPEVADRSVISAFLSSDDFHFNL